MNQVNPNSAAWMEEVETLRARAARERNMIVRLLRLPDSTADQRDLLRATTSLLREWFECEAVGIRLRDGDDFPYYETRGFPAEFLEAENTLCVRDLAGQVARDESGRPVLECMCGNVLSGRVDPNLPFFTSNGSFWTNSTTALLATATEVELQARTRNRCNSEGYESVAIVPIRSGRTVLGLIQLNDRNTGRFTLEDVLLVESLATAIGDKLARHNSEQALARSEAELRAIHDSVPAMICVLDRDRCVLYMNRAMGEFIGKPATELVSQRACGVLGCINALDDPRGCGYGPNCECCALRLAMVDTFATGTPHHSVEHRTSLVVDGRRRDVVLLGSTTLIQAGGGASLLLCLNDITERKLAEGALRESEERFRLTFDQSPIGAAILSLDYRFLRVNEALCRFTGYSAAELTGMGCSQITHPDDMAGYMEQARRLVAGEIDRYDMDERYLRKDGSMVWGHLSGRLMKDAAGKPLYFLPTVQEITERKLAEEAIRQSEARLKEAQQMAHVGSFHYDFTSDTIWWSDETYRLFGLDPGAGHPDFDEIRRLIHPDDLKQWETASRIAIEQGRSVVTENRIIRPDGSVRYHHGQVQVKVGGDGRPLEISGTIQDVTERKQAEQALRESEAILEQAARVAGLGCVVWDIKADTMNASGHLYSIIGATSVERGYTSREAIEAFVHPDDRQRVADAATAMIDSGRVRPLEIRIVRQDGQSRVIRTDGEIVRDERGEPTRCIVVLSDITKVKADEARFESMAQQLRHASRLAIMGELSAGIAHEVNQPLCSILNFAKACQNVFAQPDPDLLRVREWIDAIAAAAARAGDIVRRFSGFARRSEAKLSVVPIEELVQDSLSLVRFEAQTREVSIATSFSEPGLQVLVHPVQIQQVFVNLLRNAIEAFSEGGDRAARVLVSVTATDKEVQVSVIDNGVGLSAAQMPAVFTAFFTTKPDGLGLGLAISRTIVESYGGRIWAQSNPEGGASFHFTLARRKGA